MCISPDRVGAEVEAETEGYVGTKMARERDGALPGRSGHWEVPCSASDEGPGLMVLTFLWSKDQ